MLLQGAAQLAVAGQQQRRPLSPSQADPNNQNNGGLAQGLQQYQVRRGTTCNVWALPGTQGQYLLRRGS